ncbi:hypothetical protein LTR08_008808 [Meristemomyces frigidus]|nr:hypothetical protein LTR08_008808 [Meristemomyces frigidus]
MPPAPPPQITTGGRERVPQTSILYSDSFRTDPTVTYMLANLSPPARHAYLYTYFTALVTGAALNHAVFSEAADFSSCLVLMPPGCRADNPFTLLQAGLLGVLWNIGLKGVWRMLAEFGPMTDAVKAKGLKGRTKYYYVFFVATHAEARGRGHSSALIRDAQARATEQGVPLWIEATTEYSWRLYESLGFETVERMALGKGVVAADGTPKVSGEGVALWGMVWWPSKLATDELAAT